MPLYLVIGFSDSSATSSPKTLYAGRDGDEAVAALYKPDKKYPHRERFVNPQCVERRIDEPDSTLADDLSAQAEDHLDRVEDSAEPAAE
jgi:hypothetical protein